MTRTLSKSPFLLLGSAAVLLAACRLSLAPDPPPLPLSDRVVWEGRRPIRHSSSTIPGADSQSLTLPYRVHEFEFAGSDSVRLRLEEYRHAYSAFAVFQMQSSQQDMIHGFFRSGNAMVFHHGRFLGELHLNQAGLLPTRFLQERLSFQGESLFVPPPEFASFPLLGRISHSERVLSGHFLGRQWQGPVFSTDYRCHGDTATAFRAYAQNPQAVREWLQAWQGIVDTLEWGREIQFQGWDEFKQPLIFWIFTDAVMGFTGCYDVLLAQEYAQKMKKTRVFWSKP